MAHSLTEVSTFSPTITVPDDGDDMTAASITTPLQALANRTKSLNDRLTGAVNWVGNPQLIGSLSASLDITAGNNLVVGNDLVVGDDGSFGGDVAITGNVTADNIDIAHQLSIGNFGASSIEALGDINTQGSIYGQNGILTDGTLDVGGNTTLTGGLSVAGPAAIPNLSGSTSCSGALSAVLPCNLPKRVANGPSSTSSVNAADYDILFASLSGPITWTLTSTHAVQGSRVEIVNDTPASHNLTISGTPDGVTLAPNEMCIYVWDPGFSGGNWRLLRKW